MLKVSQQAIDNVTFFNFGVTQHTDQASLLTAINNIPYRKGFTNTAAGLDLLRDAGQPNGDLNLRDGFTHDN